MTFGSATEYLAFPRPERPACLVLDLELPRSVRGLLNKQAAAALRISEVTLQIHGIA